MIEYGCKRYGLCKDCKAPDCIASFSDAQHFTKTVTPKPQSFPSNPVKRYVIDSPTFEELFQIKRNNK